MKKSIGYVTFLVGVLLLSACAKEVKIKGELTNADKQLVRLSYGSASDQVHDTVRLDAKGQFSFRYKIKNNEPAFLILSTDKMNLATFLVENGEKLTYRADLSKPQDYVVEGSEGSGLVKELQNKLLTTSASFDSLVNVLGELEKSQAEEAALRELDLKMGSLFTKHKQFLIRFIIQHSKSFASYMAMYQKTPNGFLLFGKDSDAIYFKSLHDSLVQVYPKSQYVKQLNDDYTRLSKNVSLKELFENATEVSGMPNISLPDNTGKTHALHDLRGKYVLLSFWATWDKGSALDNIDLLETYKKYQSKGFEIYQVSLDTDPELWMKTVYNQNLPWVSVCDFAGKETYPAKLYNIQELPTTFLIDKNGDLLGKNLSDQEIGKLLK